MNKTAVVCPQGADSLNDVIFSRGVCVRITRGCFLKNSYITNFTPEDGGFLSGMGLEYNILFFESSLCYSGFPGGSAGEESTCNAGALGSIPGLGRSPGEGNGYPLQYSCLGNLMDRGDQRVAKESDMTEHARRHAHTVCVESNKVFYPHPQTSSSLPS